MLLAIDVGNTSITIGIFRREKLVSQGRIPTKKMATANGGTRALRALLRQLRVGPDAIEGVIVSSVVPKATISLKQALARLVKPKPLILGENIRASVINRYRIPSQVGQDRLVNAVAATFLYGGPAIVVDFGTAVTFDLISKKKEYLGGLIVPGIGIALEALTTRAALLPEINLVPPKGLHGRDTVASIKSGIFFGYGALCDGIVTALKKKYAPKATVIGTGGHIGLIAPYCRTIQHVVPTLTLQGLEIIARTRELCIKK